MEVSGYLPHACWESSLIGSNITRKAGIWGEGVGKEEESGT